MAISAFSFQDTVIARKGIAPPVVAPPVIACVDTSPRSSEVARAAANYAHWLGRPLILFHSVEYDRSRTALPDPLDWHLRRSEALRHLERLRDDLAGLGLSIAVEIDEGNWRTALEDRMNVRPAPMVVIGASRHSNTGHTAELLIDCGARSLLVVPTKGDVPRDSDKPRIAIPVDGSKFAEAALAEAISIARSHDAELLLIHVTPPSGIEEFGPPASRDVELGRLLDRRNEQMACIFLEQTLRRLRDQGLTARSRSLKGDPRSCLHSVIAEERPELVILSTRGQGIKSCQDLALGSTANYLLDHLTAPILLVGSTQARRGHETAHTARGGFAGATTESQRGPLNAL
ncbi:universal stress protein [Croceicoccus ponticola]|uniref:Universal stress protein n=1 Tax=Croceicoccus ponticola TaxID=2217664 RepID=A0A437H1Y4_9SPHN|nr:universal stress protein [Croceicoccus ponticola]RVQ69589.1 universal stress protein [Croceicoccus ponticola]